MRSFFLFFILVCSPLSVLAQPAIVGPSCGNGVLDAGEACDDGNDNERDVCRSNCTLNQPKDKDTGALIAVATAIGTPIIHSALSYAYVGDYGRVVRVGLLHIGARALGWVSVVVLAIDADANGDLNEFALVGTVAGFGGALAINIYGVVDSIAAVDRYNDTIKMYQSGQDPNPPLSSTPRLKLNLSDLMLTPAPLSIGGRSVPGAMLGFRW